MTATILALEPRHDVEQTLSNLEQVRQQLQEVRTIQEARHIYGLAKAATVYAREHKLGSDIVNRARAIAVEAQRRFGQIWIDAEKNTGTKGQLAGRDASGSSQLALPEDPVPTLAELGISRKVASAAKMLAGLPLDAFEQIRDGHTTLERLRVTRPDLFKGIDWKEMWRGMPGFSHKDLTACQTIQVHLQTPDDRQRLSDLLGQPLTEKTTYVWFPKAEVRIAADKRWSTAPIPPQYPVYIPTKGRWATPQTIRTLENMHVPYFAVVQPQEYDNYKPVVGRSGTILVLPDGLDGLVPTRNWIMEHSIRAGAKRHWQIDDNVKAFGRFNNNLKIDVTSGAIFKAMEDFSDRYTNVAISGPHYYMFQPSRMGAKITPVTLNTRVYSCSLINNDIPYQYRDVYNDDTDICLRALKDDWCVLLFNAFLCLKAPTMTLEGGNTPLYQGDGRLKMAESLQRQHPDCVTVTKKWGRWQHHVDYRQFRNNDLILKPDVVIPNGDPYGFTLVAADPVPDAETVP